MELLTLCHPYMAMRALDQSETIAVYAARARLSKDYDGWITHTGELWKCVYDMHAPGDGFNIHEWVLMLLDWALRFEQYCR